MVLDQVERDDLAQIEQAEMLTRLALLGTVHVKDPDGPKNMAIQAYQWYRHYLQPWQKVDLDPQKSQREAAVDEYKSRIGDPNDPVFKAKLDEEIARVRAEMHGDAALQQAEALKAQAERVARIAKARGRQRIVVKN